MVELVFGDFYCVSILNLYPKLKDLKVKYIHMLAAVSTSSRASYFLILHFMSQIVYRVLFHLNKNIFIQMHTSTKMVDSQVKEGSSF